MSRTYIQRDTGRRRGISGCLIVALLLMVALLIGFFLLLPALPSFVMGLVGFRPIGQTAQVYRQPVTPPQIQAGTSAGVLTVNTGFGTIRLENAQSATVDGRTATIVRLTETQLNVLCRTHLQFCGQTPTPPLYDAAIDLRSGGAVISGMVYVSSIGIYQHAGLAVRVEGLRVTLSGVDFGGTLYSLPESGLGLSVGDVQRRIEETLRGITAAGDGRMLTLSSLYADDTSLTLVFR